MLEEQGVDYDWEWVEECSRMHLQAMPAEKFEN